MKIFSLLITVPMFYSLQVTAMPNVGDYAAYQYTTTSDQTVVNGLLEYELTGFDSKSMRFEFKETNTETGKKPVVRVLKNVNPTQFKTDGQIDQILKQCVSWGGRLEDVTIPNGTTFHTCAAPDPDSLPGQGTLWYGQVPFGAIKGDTTDSTGHSVTLLLRFRFGKGP